MKTLLVDGSNLAHIHFAANPALDDNGNPIGVVRGFLSNISYINKLYRPTKIIAFFDGEGGSFQRRQLYKDYKSGRAFRKSIGGKNYEYSSPEDAKKNFEWQLSLLYELLEYCGITVIITSDYESDDGISYYANIYREEDEECLIYSCDKDYYQLVSENIKIYNSMMKKFITKEYIIEKFGIHPNNWLFYRAITGDASDNIDGIKGFGPKTLKKLFFLENEKKTEIDSIKEGVKILSEGCADQKEKTLLKRLTALDKDIDKIERNIKLMDLKNPMVSLYSKEKLDYQFMENPKPNNKAFYGRVTEVGIPINKMMPSEFYGLKK